MSRARASVRVRHQRVTQLFLLRHAHAGNPAKWKGDDAQRPLSEKGTRQSERVGRFLSQVGFQPDAIVSSPKLRATQTAEIVARQLRMNVRLEERLAGGADLHDFEAILADLGLDRPMLVGHDPDFSDLVADLTRSQDIAVGKGAFLRVDVDRPLAAGSGILRWLVPPDLLLTAD